MILDQNEKFLTPPEAATHAGVARSTIERWRRLPEGALPSYRKAGRILIRQRDLDEFLEPKRVGGEDTTGTREEMEALVKEWASDRPPNSKIRYEVRPYTEPFRPLEYDSMTFGPMKVDGPEEDRAEKDPCFSCGKGPQKYVTGLCEECHQVVMASDAKWGAEQMQDEGVAQCEAAPEKKDRKSIRPSDPNDPNTFVSLSEDEQNTLVDWIRHSYTAAVTPWEQKSSYAMKHDFEEDHFYLTNGQFKGAMRVAGFEPVNVAERNWHFRLRPKASEA